MINLYIIYTAVCELSIVLFFNVLSFSISCACIGGLKIPDKTHFWGLNFCFRKSFQGQKVSPKKGNDFPFSLFSEKIVCKKTTTCLKKQQRFV